MCIGAGATPPPGFKKWIRGSGSCDPRWQRTWLDACIHSLIAAQPYHNRGTQFLVVRSLPYGRKSDQTGTKWVVDTLDT